MLQETYAYAKTLLDVATSNADGRTRALLVGGGIANFTDVAATFRGIIQVSTTRLVCQDTPMGALCQKVLRLLCYALQAETASQAVEHVSIILALVCRP